MGRKKALSTLWLPGPSAVGYARKKRAKIKSTNKMIKPLRDPETMKKYRNYRQEKVQTGQQTLAKHFPKTVVDKKKEISLKTALNWQEF
jgi:hypothetical protein